MFALPALSALQLLPLPLAILELLSPLRAEAVAAAVQFGGSPMSSLSVAPESTLNFLLLSVILCAVFCTTRSLAACAGRDPWRLLAPLVVLALAEGLLGLSQAQPGAFEAGVAGSFVNRNHYAAFLCCIPPLVLARLFGHCAAAHGRGVSIGVLAAACLLIGAAALHSMSRTGLVALAVSAVWMAGLLVPRRAIAIPSLLVTPIGFALLAPPELVSRLLSGDTAGRLDFWRETLRLIHHYPLSGCGLGAFELAIYPWRESAPALLLDYAHNDFLQLAAETGVLGLPVILCGVVLIVRLSIRRVPAAVPNHDRFLVAGCGAALLSFCVFGMFDSNLRVPVNAVTASWILGVLAGMESTSRYRPAKIGARAQSV
ncbi:MAG: O-antigen ligase family protein [Bryobacteraceae bacterium]